MLGCGCSLASKPDGKVVSVSALSDKLSFMYQKLIFL